LYSSQDITKLFLGQTMHGENLINNELVNSFVLADVIFSDDHAFISSVVYETDIFVVKAFTKRVKLNVELSR